MCEMAPSLILNENKYTFCLTVDEYYNYVISVYRICKENYKTEFNF